MEKMKSPISAMQWLPMVLLLIQIMYTTANPLGIPNGKHHFGGFPNDPKWRSTGRILGESNIIDKNLKTFYYNQTLDHFNYRPESYNTFQQKYLINSKYWGGAKANAPIFAYLGAEAPQKMEVTGVGFLSDNAARFRALQVYIEHRYYGESMPFGSREEAYKNASTRGYFNSAQALADYAEILIHIKEKLNAKYSPLIVFGSSYGGDLASWFRLKYPHVALGALASSAPVLSSLNKTGNYGLLSVVDRVFRETSKSCHHTIKKGLSEIQQISSQPNGLSILSKKFKTCKPITTITELAEPLVLSYIKGVQYNSPPDYIVSQICKAIEETNDDPLGKILAGLIAYNGNVKKPCYVNEDVPADQPIDETSVGWPWQTCSEIYGPYASNNNESMFGESKFEVNDFLNTCKQKYGVPPRIHWLTTYYGGNDIKLILKRFGSNIIFSNGLRDPHSSGGVLENISDSIVAVNTEKGSHCLDIQPARKGDPTWLTEQRQTEVKIIERWISQYYSDLRAYKQGNKKTSVSRAATGGRVKGHAATGT